MAGRTVARRWLGVRRSIAAVVLLFCSQGAVATPILRSSGANRTYDPATAEAGRAAAAAVPANQTGLRAALDAIRRFQAAQDAARGAAAGANTGVPNGLAQGGLTVAGGEIWLNATAPVQTALDGRTEVTVTQTGQRSILSWSSFNVGSLTDLVFDQSAGGKDVANWAVLNRVLDPTASPSKILGSIKAGGQVYILNQNGILFGGTSQVNVGSLLASSLDLAGGTLEERNLQFLSGSLSSLAFAGGSGEVKTEAGATIGAAAGGRVVLLGNRVENAGAIRVDDGQVYLAAGGSITLAPSGDLGSVRGLAPPASRSSPVLAGIGEVVNSGIIDAQRGSIVLVAPVTRQLGLLSATTGAKANGAIFIGGDGTATSFGESSVTQILPDQGDAKVLGGGANFKGSSVDVRGDSITLLDGATIYAPGGRVALTAVMTAPAPSDTTDPSLLDDTRIYVGQGARIDVSGLQDVEVAMEQNSIQGELRAAQLRDNPLVRDGPLRGRTVYFDGRLGGKLVDGSGVADLSGYYDLLTRDVSQLMTSGGTVAMAANQVVTRAGSVIDISGGSVRYRDGLVRRTILIDAAGNRVPIEQASQGVRYVGADSDVVSSHGRWGVSDVYAARLSRGGAGFEAGYLQGFGAGTLRIDSGSTYWYDDLLLATPTGPKPASPSATGLYRVLDGSILASTVAGPHQRESPSGSTSPIQAWRERPAGATLQISGAGDVTIGPSDASLGLGFGPSSQVDPARRYRLDLPGGWFDGRTFSSVAISSGFDSDDNGTNYYGTTNRAPGGVLSVGPGVVVNVGDGGSFSFTGKSAAIDGTLLAPGGVVSLSTTQLGGDPAVAATLHLGSTGLIDVAGRWSNDWQDGSSGPLRALNGGRVSLTGAAVLLDPGSRVDVSGGARLDASGTRIAAGDAGAISINVARFPVPSGDPLLLTDPFLGRLELGGTLEGRALGKGGTLSIRTGFDVFIGDRLPDGAGPEAWLVPTSFFTQGGFSSYSLVGERGLTLVAGTVLAPEAETLVAPPHATELPSGVRLVDVTLSRLLPEGQRRPMSVDLSAAGSTPYTSNLVIDAGATIRMEPGSSVTLSAGDLLREDGVIDAPGGHIDLSVVRGTGTGQGLLIGSEAVLRAPGVLKTTPGATRDVRSLMDGGTVALTAPVVVVDEGAVIDLSGVSGFADLPAPGSRGERGQYVPVLMDGSAGSLSVKAGSGIVQGDLRLSGGGVAGAGGSLSVDYLPGGFIQSIIVTQHSRTYTPGQSLTLVADSVDGSGVADLAIRVAPAAATSFANQTAIMFDGDVSLGASRSLTLVSPILSRTPGSTPTKVKLTAWRVALDGLPSSRDIVLATPSTGGEFEVVADVIDVSRNVSFGCISTLPGCLSDGFSTVTLRARGDIRFSDHDLVGNISSTAGLFAPGSLELNSAQAYVTSRIGGGGDRASTQPGFLVQAGQRIVVKGNGNPAPVPLSFGERLTLRAPLIEQGGVLRAPQGQIQLDARDFKGIATGSVTLLPGSLTSVSLEGATVPFGAAQYGGYFPGYSLAGQAPTKSIKLAGPSVSVQAGAVVDVSGGGDLLGYLFTPGNEGSTDVLGARTNTAGTIVTDKSGNPLSATSLGKNLPAPFAILPGQGTQLAPVARNGELRDNRLQVGDQVWLQGVPGLLDGYYTLLPAHYALLPGALLIQPLGGAFGSAPATYVRADGALVASGYSSHVVLDGNGDDRRVEAAAYTQFAVMNQQVAAQYGQFLTYSFDQSARSLAFDSGLTARVPLDAGGLVLSASNSLLLDGTGRFGAPQGGLLGTVDVAASKIAVVGASNAGAYAGFLILDPQALTDFGAGSILLGGTRATSRDTSAPGTVVSVTATQVVVDTKGTPWVAPEILIASLGQVTVADGSVLRAEGAATGDLGTLRLAGDGALLRLSTSGRVDVGRSSTAGLAGNLTIGAANLSTPGSMALDASQTVALDPNAALTALQLDLASNQVHLGDVPAGTTGTVLGSDLLGRLASSSELLIRGRDAILVHGDVVLGSRTAGTAGLASLTLDTGLLQGVGDGSDRITAGRLTLRNSGGGGAGAAGNGTLALDVDTLRLGPGDVALAGFSALQGAAGIIEVVGAGSLGVGGDLSIATGRLQVTSGTSYHVSAGGALSLTAGTSAGIPTPVTSLGGWLSLEGASILLDTAVVLPAGTLQASARSGALTLGDGALIDVSGRAVSFADQVRYAPGGSIRLEATGDLTIAPGASLDVSGAAPGGAAGTIELVSGGKASVLGHLTGRAASGYAGGAFSLDAGSVPSFAALNGALEAGGFNEARLIRLRGGQDLTVSEGERVAAHDVLLQADGGKVTIAGTIGLAGDAAHPAGGIIELVGGAGVSLAGTARIDAQAAGSNADGFTAASGAVLISATGASGEVDVAGATIDVSGGRSGGGTIIVRAPRTSDGVAVGQFAGAFLGATLEVVQGLASYDATGAVIDAAWMARPLQEASTWLTAAQARYPSGLAGFQLAPAILVSSAGGLSLQGDISLSQLNGRGQAVPGGPGYLGFVARGATAAGDISIQGSLSDGFDGASRTASLLAGNSFSLSFEARGNLTLAPGAMVRTGTGSISVRVGGNLVLQDSTSVIYTAGSKTAWATGFLGVPTDASGAPLKDQAGNPLAIGEFADHGGSIFVRAGGDILAPVAAQTTSAWLWRYGDTAWNGDAPSSTVAQQTSWSVVYGNFEQGIGALGGGDIRVSAGGDIRNLQVSIPTTGQLAAPVGATPVASDLVVRGGGDLRLGAGHDLLGGLVLLGKGVADLRAGGRFAAGDPVPLRSSAVSATLGSPRPVGLLLAVADGSATLTAGGNLYLEGLFDPMRQGLIKSNLAGGTGGSAFWGYTDRTAVSASALGGLLTMENDPWASVDLSLAGKSAYQVRMAGSGSSSLNDQLSRLPPTLRLVSFDSSVVVEDHFGFRSTVTLAAAPRGTLEILAHQDAVLAIGLITMEDIAPAYGRGPLDAFSTSGDLLTLGVSLDSVLTNSQRGFTPIHENDPSPVRIYAASGSVCAQRAGACVRLATPQSPSDIVQVYAPKPIDVIAGRDVVSGWYQPQNNGPNDVSIIQAGRDLYQPILVVSGEGSAILQAGRSVLFGEPTIVGGDGFDPPVMGGAVLSVGNRQVANADVSARSINAALPADRATDVLIMAGTGSGVDYAAFASKYIGSQALGLPHGYLHADPSRAGPALDTYMAGLGYGTLSDGELVAAFEALPLAGRETFLNQVFFTELKETGIDYNDPKSPRYQSYERGYRAIANLFPTDPASLADPNAGNVILAGKQVQTEAEASISILAPYGVVQVGAAVVQKGENTAKGGVVTLRGGDVRIFADRNIDLYTSRVFTQQGGDITMWTTEGSITAGSGSKTSVVDVPLQYSMNKDGVVAVDAFGLVTGAGIGVLDATGSASDRPHSRLDLIAPRGEVNAGDAGIRAVGDLNIAARVVVGIENIRASGATTGVPKVEAPSMDALTTAGDVSRAAQKEGVGPDPMAAQKALAELPSIITVEVIGYEVNEEDQKKDRRRPKGAAEKKAGGGQ